jgi:predicted Zn-dependent protease with MMP-like domain
MRDFLAVAPEAHSTLYRRNLQGSTVMRSMARLTEEETREAVQEALDALPAEIAGQLDGVAVIVEDRHPAGLMGIYDPRGGLKRIVIFREANPSREEVRRTVWHEVGHYFGMDEEHIHRLGYG